MLELKFKYEAGMFFDSECNVWVAWIPCLNLWTQHPEKDKVQDSLKKTAELWTKVTYNRGQLDGYMRDRGHSATTDPGRMSEPPDDFSIDGQFPHGLERWNLEYSTWVMR